MPTANAAPPSTSLGKCRPSRTRSTPTITAIATIATTHAIRRLRRRTNRIASTIITPANAVTDVVCPLGKLWFSTTPVGSCHSGRSRPSTCLKKVVARAFTIITPAVKNAARRWPRTSSSTVTTTVKTVIPMVPRPCSTTRSEATNPSCPPVQLRAGLPSSSIRTNGCHLWVTSVAVSAKNAKQAALMPRFHARDRSITVLRSCRVGLGCGKVCR